MWQAKHACPHHSCDCVERGMVPTSCTIQRRQAVAVRLKGPHDRQRSSRAQCRCGLIALLWLSHANCKVLVTSTADDCALRRRRLRTCRSVLSNL